MFIFVFLYQEKNLPSDYKGSDGEGERLENKIQTIPCKYHSFQMEELPTVLEVSITKILSTEIILSTNTRHQGSGLI